MRSPLREMDDGGEYLGGSIRGRSRAVGVAFASATRGSERWVASARRAVCLVTTADGYHARGEGAARAAVVTVVRSVNNVPSAPTFSSPVSPPSSAHDVRELVVPESLDGSRVDKAVAQLLPELSRARVKRAIELGAVRVNGRRLPKGGTVATGDAVRIDVAQVAEGPATATPDAPLKVVMETAQLVVVDKPAGQPTAPIRAGEIGTLVNAILGRYPELVASDGETFIGHSAREPGIIHRLDTETSGAVVVARNAEAFETLKSALKEERIDKRYLLVCAGEGLPDEGTIEFPLTNHPKDQRRVHACVHPRDVTRYEPRPACTRYRVVKRTANWALVEARVGKALRHQIRAHFSAIGHPLAGDELYGGHVIRALGRHALHAARVVYAGGGGIEAFDVSVPLPKEMATLLES